METDNWNYKQPHLCWSSVRDNKRDVRKGIIRSRLLTGTYKTQDIISRYEKLNGSTLCRLCKQDEEDYRHFLLKVGYNTTNLRYKI